MNIVDPDFVGDDNPLDDSSVAYRVIRRSQEDAWCICLYLFWTVCRVVVAEKNAYGD